MGNQEISKFIALILRHKPESIGIALDQHGWANVDELIAGINKVTPFTKEKLEEIVRTDNKQRYSFSEDHAKIRANQGHSVHVDVDLKRKTPPSVLFHGTGEKYVPSILQQGLIPKSRLYVHLSWDTATAENVAIRHGKPVIFSIDAETMVKDGYEFYLSANQVWLTKEVPARYLSIIKKSNGSS